MARRTPSDDRLYDDPDLAQFYDLENGWGPDFDFCASLAENARSLLDLGCGTGQFAAGLAEKRGLNGLEVFGVDPAVAMLEIAQRRPGGGLVTWIEADSRDLRLARRFDLIVLTGHAFQVFLTAEDQAAVLATIARHLSPRGRFLFDSRNPLARDWTTWTPELSRRHLDHPQLGRVAAWNDVAHDAATGIVTYQTHYRIATTGQQLSAASQIRFTPREALASLIAEAGLSVTRWLGDWQGGDFEPASPEIIPLGGLVQLAAGG